MEERMHVLLRDVGRRVRYPVPSAPPTCLKNQKIKNPFYFIYKFIYFLNFPDFESFLRLKVDPTRADPLLSLFRRTPMNMFFQAPMATLHMHEATMRGYERTYACSFEG